VARQIPHPLCLTPAIAILDQAFLKRFPKHITGCQNHDTHLLKPQFQDLPGKFPAKFETLNHRIPYERGKGLLTGFGQQCGRTDEVIGALFQAIWVHRFPAKQKNISSHSIYSM
jgi:hypothetical protein